MKKSIAFSVQAKPAATLRNYGFQPTNCHVCVIALRHIHFPGSVLFRSSLGNGDVCLFRSLLLTEPSFLSRICSVYVRNLEERIKPDALKEALHAIYSEYGNIIDIVAKTNLKAKGQAFIVFDKPESAAQAIEETQGFELFDKPIHVALARTRSDATVKTTGNDQDFELHQRRRLAEKGTHTIHTPLLPHSSNLSVFLRMNECMNGLIKG